MQSKFFEGWLRNDNEVPKNKPYAKYFSKSVKNQPSPKRVWLNDHVKHLRREIETRPLTVNNPSSFSISPHAYTTPQNGQPNPGTGKFPHLMDDLEVMEPPRTDPNVLTPDSQEPTPMFMKDEPVACLKV